MGRFRTIRQTQRPQRPQRVVKSQGGAQGGLTGGGSDPSDAWGESDRIFLMHKASENGIVLHSDSLNEMREELSALLTYLPTQTLAERVRLMQAVPLNEYLDPTCPLAEFNTTFGSSTLITNVLLSSSPLSSFKENCKYLQNTIPFSSWIGDQAKYIASLNVADLLILKDYTFHGDRVINTFLRGNTDQAVYLYFKYWMNHDLRKPLFTDGGDLALLLGKPISTHSDIVDIFRHDWNIIRDYIWSIIKRLQQLIWNAPVLENDVVCYRSEKDISYWKYVTENKNYYSNSFLSTTISIPYQGPGPFGKYLTVLYLPRASHCLYMVSASRYPEEFELLLPINCTFHILEKHQEYQVTVFSIYRFMSKMRLIQQEPSINLDMIGKKSLTPSDNLALERVRRWGRSKRDSKIMEKEIWDYLNNIKLCKGNKFTTNWEMVTRFEGIPFDFGKFCELIVTIDRAFPPSYPVEIKPSLPVVCYGTTMLPKEDCPPTDEYYYIPSSDDTRFFHSRIIVPINSDGVSYSRRTDVGGAVLFKFRFDGGKTYLKFIGEVVLPYMVNIWSQTMALLKFRNYILATK